MMYQISSKEVTNQDSLVQFIPSPSTSIEEINREDSLVNVPSNWIRQPFEKQPYYSLLFLFEADFSSIYPHFKIKSETSIRELEESKEFFETVTEEEIALEMIDHDFIVRMPPKKRYQIDVLVRSIKKGEPRAINSDEFYFESGE